MRKKEIIGRSIESISKSLPKTTNAIDEIGATIFGLFGTILAPIKAINIYKDIKLEQLKNNWRAKVEKIPNDQFRNKIDLNIVGPTLEAFKYTIFEDDLGKMFENLLASSFDKRKSVFPSFVDIIRQLNSDEAKLLKYLSQHGTDYPLIDLKYVLNENNNFYVEKSDFTDIGDEILEKPELMTAYLNDLRRFGLIDIQNGVYLVGDNIYSKLENNKVIQKIRSIKKEEPGRYEIEKKKFVITAYGDAFIKACVE